MKLITIPAGRNILPMTLTEGDDARERAASILRGARRTATGALKPREDRPRSIGVCNVWKLANGLLKLCL